jgi:hypothetical protein
VADARQAFPSRSVRGASEHANVERRVGRRGRIGDEGHGGALGDLAGTPVGRAGPDTPPEPRLSASTDPSAQRRPRGHLAIAPDLLPNVRDPSSATETKERQRDGGRAEVATAKHASGDDHDHGVAATAPVPANGHDSHHGRRTDRGRTTYLPQPKAMPDDPERLAYRPARPVAARAAGWPDLADTGQTVRPNVDIEEGMKDV